METWCCVDRVNKVDATPCSDSDLLKGVVSSSIQVFISVLCFDLFCFESKRKR